MFAFLSDDPLMSPWEGDGSTWRLEAIDIRFFAEFTPFLPEEQGSKKITMTWPMRSGHGSSPSDTNCPFGKGTLVSKDEVLRNVLRTFGTRRAGTFPENARPEVPSACCSERDLVTSKDVTDLRVSKIDYQRSTDSVTPPTRIAELGGSVTTDGYCVVARHRARAS